MNRYQKCNADDFLYHSPRVTTSFKTINFILSFLSTKQIFGLDTMDINNALPFGPDEKATSRAGNYIVFSDADGIIL